MYNKFCSTNLPWNDSSCKHPLSGFSGIFYLLPIFLQNSYFWDNIAWIIQAILSIISDYIFIQQPHFIHGIDKLFAVFNISRIMYRVYIVLGKKFLLPTIPMLFLFAFSQYFKFTKNVQYWIYCHFCWHLVGSLTCVFALYLLR